jgi:hypothetical protein
MNDLRPSLGVRYGGRGESHQGSVKAPTYIQSLQDTRALTNLCSADLAAQHALGIAHVGHQAQVLEHPHRHSARAVLGDAGFVWRADTPACGRWVLR